MSSDWRIEFSPRAAKAFRKLDRGEQQRIQRFLHRLRATADPRERGKALVGTKRGLWRWRVGDYRIIADIVDDKVLIVLIDIGHRSSVYMQ